MSPGPSARRLFTLSTVGAVMSLSSAKGFLPESLVAGVLCFQGVLVKAGF